jgi:hypothetical protein
LKPLYKSLSLENKLIGKIRREITVSSQQKSARPHAVLVQVRLEISLARQSIGYLKLSND